MPNFEEVLTQHANCPPFFMNKPSDLLTKTNLDATPLKRPQRKKSVGVLVTHTMKYCLQIMFFLCKIWSSKSTGNPQVCSCQEYNKSMILNLLRILTKVLEKLILHSYTSMLLMGLLILWRFPSFCDCLHSLNKLFNLNEGVWEFYRVLNW